jgi:hypothetical protein
MCKTMDRHRKWSHIALDLSGDAIMHTNKHVISISPKQHQLLANNLFIHTPKTKQCTQQYLG